MNLDYLIDLTLGGAVAILLIIFLAVGVKSCTDSYMCKGLAGGKAPFSELLVKNDKCFKYDGTDYKFIGVIE